MVCHTIKTSECYKKSHNYWCHKLSEIKCQSNIRYLHPKFLYTKTANISTSNTRTVMNLLLKKKLIQTSNQHQQPEKICQLQLYFREKILELKVTKVLYPNLVMLLEYLYLEVY